MAAPQKASYSPFPREPVPPLPLESMHEPLHPMHRELQRRMTGVVDVEQRLPHTTRFAILFYTGLLAWGVVGVVAVTAFS